MWASAGGSSSSSELKCLAVRLANIPYHVSPGFSSIDAGMYVRAAALHRRSRPLSAVLPSEGERGVRGLYRLFCPVRGNKVRSPMPRCHGVRVAVLHGEG